MNDINNELQHPDFVWTWKESVRGVRQSLWLPYFSGVAKKPRNSCWVIEYNGGSVDADLSKIDFIMLYGATGSLSVAFLDALNDARVCLMIHRRNMPRPYVFAPASGSDDDDILTAQITARANLLSSAYVARTLIRERLHSFSSAVKVSATEFKELAAARSIEQVRSIEAAQTARYWAAYYKSLGEPDLVRRNCDHPINDALNAGSFFLHGVLLRWVLFHKLSPFHGFLHRPTGYPSLVFDLIEPYRYWIEKSVADAFLSGAVEKEQLLAESIKRLKACLEEPVYVPATRQTVRRKSLLHGSVLSLRAWLLDKQTRFTLPVEGSKKGGRPPQVGYSIPGYRIG